MTAVYFTWVCSCDGCQYICKTCDSKLKKGKLPCQVVCNNLELLEFPEDIPFLNKVEKVIISKKIIFESTS